MADFAEPGTEKPLQARFHLMAEYIEDGVALLENNRFALVNDRLCEILGYSRRELGRLGDLDVAAPEERNRLKQTRKELGDLGSMLDNLEFWALRRDGSRRYLRNWYGSGPEGKKDPRRFLVTTDLTAQKVPAQVPAERESFLRQIIDASPDLVFVKDREGSYVLVNRGYAAACHHEPEDFVGKDDLEMGWPEELVRGNPQKGIKGSWADEREVMANGRARSASDEWMWVGDRRRQFATTKMPLRDAEGSVWGLMAFAREVTAYERALAQAEMLHDISQSLVTATDTESLLHVAAAPAMKSGADAAVLLYVDVDVDGEPEWAEVVAAIGLATTAPGTRFHLPDLPRMRLLVASLTQPMVIADTDAQHEGVGEEMRGVMQLEHIRGLALLPLRAHQRWQGMVMITWPEPHESSPEEEQLYELIGSHLAARVQAQRMHEKAGHRAMWSQTAAEVSQAAASILDLDELSHRVVNLIHDRFGLCYAGLFLVDHDSQGSDAPGRWAVLRVGTGEAGEQMVRQGHRLDIGGGSMVGQCLATKQPRIALDVGEEAARFANPLLPETRTELALPLVSRGQALGALSIQSDRAAAFSEEDIAVLQAMADQLAIAIDNAHLIGQARARARREQLVRTISERIRRGGDRETIMRTTVEEMGRMLGASKAIIRLGSRVELGVGPDEGVSEED